MDSKEPLLPRVIAASDRWLVVSKPAGWLTIPASDSRNSLTAASVLSEWAKSLGSQIWVVHRLDRETSGVVLFARSAQAHQEANQWFQQRKMKKVYHCLSVGNPTAPLFKIQKEVGGVAAVSQVEVKEKFSEGFLARVLPQTGRRHQIRIHLSSLGYPIFGDVLYGGPREVQLCTEVMKVGRVALHASSLRLPTGEVFEDELPKDFQGWLEELRISNQQRKVGQNV